MDYKLKYEKYKAKYLELKNELYIAQSGGSNGKPELYLFRAEWCGHCKDFKKEWEKLEKNIPLNEKVELIPMDDVKNKKEIEEWGVKGFPTIILKNGNKAIEYKGERSANAIEKFLNEKIN